jgi:hypothetical protein
MRNPRDAQNALTTPAGSWLEVSCILLLFYVVGGATAPHANETHYLTKAYHYWHPQWCAGDLFLESDNPHLLFYWTVGALTKWLTMPTVAWVGRLLAWAVLAWSWQRLSARVVPSRLVSVVTAVLMVTLLQWGNFAGEWVVGGIESKCFAYVFVFWGLAEMADGRWSRVWPLLGIAAAWHVLVGGWAVVAGLVVWGTESKESRPSVTSQLVPLLLGGVLALPGVLPSLLMTSNVPPDIVRQANEIYVFGRLPHHLAPLKLPPEELLGHAVRFGSLLAVAMWLWLFIRHRPGSGNTHHALERIQRFAAASILIATCGLLLEVALWYHPALAAGVLKYYWFRLADVAVPLAVALGLGWLMADWQNLQPVLRTAIAGLLVVTSLTLPQTALSRWWEPNPPAEGKVLAARDWQEACHWIRDNTPSTAVVLIPRLAQSFTWHAERANVCNWKDVPQDPTALVAWNDRYQAIYTYVDHWGERQAYRGLGELGADRLREFAAKYRFEFILTEEYPPVDLPEVFRNGSYTLYTIADQEGSHQ